ncbi:Uncharacterised protein [Yersinia enterocolitica]|nr:Uncharacterised protein [Yersinia enterocolitica]
MFLCNIYYIGMVFILRTEILDEKVNIVKDD